MNTVSLTARVLEALVNRAKLLRRLMIGLMALVIVIDMVKPSAYSRFPWDGIPGFTALYAFVGALLLVGVYKAIGFGLVYRANDYYGGESQPHREESSDE